jgi:predicted membrane protein
MRMDFFFGNIFWGIMIILFGVSIFLRGFNINLPLMKVFFAIVIIMFGVRMLVGGGKPRVHNRSYSSNRNSTVFYSSGSQEYTMVFASGEIDLSDIQPDAKDMEITVVFGSATVILPSDLKFDIKPTAVLGSIVLPNAGKFTGSNKGEKNIGIEATSVFGRLEFAVKETIRNFDTKTEEPVNPEEGF